jgi:hypothetical protein
MRDYVLAQLNIAQMKYSIEAPEMADFVASVDRINQLAEKSPGFVWRFTGDPEQELAVFGPGILVNFSCWDGVDSLHNYVFKSAHTDIMRRRKTWFDHLKTSSVMWWHKYDEPPTLKEAGRRLQLLAANGAGNEAFTFARPALKPVL